MNHISKIVLVKMLGIIFFLACIFTSTLQAQTTTEEWKTYKTPASNPVQYQISYPADWDLKVLNGDQLGLVSPEGPIAVVTVSTQDLSGWTESTTWDLDTYLKVHDGRMPKYLNAYEVVEKKKGTFAGQEAYWQNYRTVDKVDPRWIQKNYSQTFIINGKIACEVGYSAIPEKFDEYLAKGQAMLDSFKLTEK